MNPRLVPLKGGNPLVINEDMLLVGRAGKCDIHVDHKSVSKNHCVIARHSDRLTVIDLDSTNGTYINNRKAVRGTLKTGDILHVAGVKYKVEMPSNPFTPAESMSSISSVGKMSSIRARVTIPEIHNDDLVTEGWKAGMEVFDGCKLLEVIGEGGFGKVWRANKSDFGDLALKWIRVTDPIRNEGRALRAMSGLRHKHLVRVFGCRRKGDVLVVAMELGQETLEHRYLSCVKQGLPGIPIDELMTQTKQVAEALDYLYYSRKLLHRDIKPRNILLVDGVAKVCDMGLTKVLENEEGFHSGIGTFEYAPPEFFEGKMVATSDQFSLAVTYSFLFCGKNPFPGPDARKIMLQHLMGNPQLDGLPAVQRPVVQKALKKNPAERFESCSHFARALRRAQAGKRWEE